MLLASSGSQLHLLLAFLKTRLFGGGEIPIATGTRHPFFVVLRCLVCLSDGMPAGIALVEAAFFNPMSIRATARKLKLHSAASYRFERSINSENIDWASRR